MTERTTATKRRNGDDDDNDDSSSSVKPQSKRKCTRTTTTAIMKMPTFSLPAHQNQNRASSSRQSREKHHQRYNQQQLSSSDEQDRDDMMSLGHSPQCKADSSSQELSLLIVPVPSSISTPPLSAATNGWRTMNQLHQIAAVYNGMAIQYRILYSSKEIKDHNPGSTKPIPPNVLVVQSRFATKTRSAGGCSYRLSDWKLPGGLKRRNAQHMTIYRDTRPSFYQEGVPDNAFPVIILDAGIPSNHVDILNQFIMEGESGKTLTMFCDVHDLETPDMKDVAIAGVGEAHQEEHQHHAMIDNDDDDEEDEQHHNAGVDVDNSNAATNEDKQNLTPITEDKTHAIDTLKDARPKRKASAIETLNNRLGLASFTKRPKNYGGLQSRQRHALNFVVGESNYFALIEGVANGMEENSSMPKSQDYIRDLFLNGRLDKLPHRGRLLELPGEIVPGNWIGHVVGGPVSGLRRESMRNLTELLICFRHERAECLGPLTRRAQSSMIPPQWNDVELSVSAFCPTPNRKSSMVSQGALVDDDPHEETALIGSISLAAFEGFSSSSDAIGGACSITEALLKRCQLAADSGSLQYLLPIPSTDGDNDHIGGSFLCQIRFGEEYHLLIARDGQGRIVGIDVLFKAPRANEEFSGGGSAGLEVSHQLLNKDILQKHNVQLSVLENRAKVENLVAKKDASPSIPDCSSAKTADQDDDIDAESSFMDGFFDASAWENADFVTSPRREMMEEFDVSPKQTRSMKRNEKKTTVLTDSRRCGVGAWALIFGIFSWMVPSCHRLPSSYNTKTHTMHHNTSTCMDLAAELLLPVDPQVEVEAGEFIGGLSSTCISSWEMLCVDGWW